MRAPRGFTMIELLIALAIMAIGATLAAPLFTSLIESSRLTATANNVIEAIATARAEAVKQGRDVEVAPITDGEWSGGWLVRDVLTQTEIVRFDAVPNGLTIGASEDLASVGFGPNGARLAGGQDVTISLCGRPEQGGKGRQISLSRAGSTKVEKIESGCSS